MWASAALIAAALLRFLLLLLTAAFPNLTGPVSPRLTDKYADL